MVTRNAWRTLTPTRVRTDAAGSTHRRSDPSDAAGYVGRVYDDYLTYGGLDPASLRGARVLELGPGDSLGVALRFVAAGAEHVTCVERHQVWKDRAHQAAIYRRILEGLDGRERERAESAIVLTDDDFTLDAARIELVEGPGAENLGELIPATSIDLIISRAVMEYVPAIERSLHQQAELLKPGALMIHKVDLRDHGLFTGAGHHPLTFLEVPERAYRAMSTRTGLPNRWRSSDYRNALESEGLEVSILTTHAAGVDEEVIPHVPALSRDRYAESFQLVSRTRTGLAKRFRDLPDQDLASIGVFLVARAPEGGVR